MKLALTKNGKTKSCKVYNILFEFFSHLSPDFLNKFILFTKRHKASERRGKRHERIFSVGATFVKA